MTRTSSEAEDAAQEIFSQIWSAATSFDPAKGSETVFIAMLARRRLIDRRRKAHSELLIDSSVDVAEAFNRSEPGTFSQAMADADAAMYALKQLRPEQRQILELGLVHGLTQSEISAELNVPLGTVKSNMRRGLIEVQQQRTHVALTCPVAVSARLA